MPGGINMASVDGATIARCPDEASAELIALAITYVGLPQDRIPPLANKRLAELTQ